VTDDSRFDGCSSLESALLTIMRKDNFLILDFVFAANWTCHDVLPFVRLFLRSDASIAQVIRLSSEDLVKIQTNLLKRCSVVI
jgi:hypothetical protein